MEPDIARVQGIGMRQLQSEALTLHLIRQMSDKYRRSPGAEYTSAQGAASAARQAMAYASSAEHAAIEVLPVLRYYQWLHTLKSLLFLFVPEFPPSATVLQHGLSVRRIKRSGYRWPLEKILIHQEGILQSFHILFFKSSLPDKLLVGDLVGSIPQLSDKIGQFYQHLQHAYPLTQVDTSLGLYKVSRKIASNQGLTVNEWRKKFFAATEAKANQLLSANPVPEDPKGWLNIHIPFPNHPWLKDYNGVAFLCDGPTYPPYLLHCGLLFSLSALSRYSAIEWSDIVHWQNEEDALLVREYLRLPMLHPVIDTDEEEISADSVHWIADGQIVNW